MVVTEGCGTVSKVILDNNPSLTKNKRQESLWAVLRYVYRKQLLKQTTTKNHAHTSRRAPL